MPVIYAPTGAQVDYGGSSTDTNGNSLSTSGSGSSILFYDSIGRLALTTTDNTSSHTTSYVYNDASNSPQTATMSLTALSVYSSFQCSGITDYSGSPIYLPTSLQLADMSTYTFDYEMSTVSGHTSATTGRLAKITLPTGGYIQYA